jgi:dipeptidyl aminopeptidase/acylaminoacyl peptidase
MTNQNNVPARGVQALRSVAAAILYLAFVAPAVAHHYTADAISEAALLRQAQDSNVAVIIPPFAGSHLYVPNDGAATHPAILALDGSAGGETNWIDSGFAIGLAAQGFAVLALDYYHNPGLPKDLVMIAVERAFSGADWLTANGYATGKPGLYGISFGATYALLIAAKDRGRRFSALAAYAPHGRAPAGFVPPYGLSAKPAFKFRNKGVPSGTVFEMWRFPGPVLLVHGRKDTLNPYGNSTLLVREMRQHGKTNVSLKSFNGGHWFTTATYLVTYRAVETFFKTHFGVP